MSETILRHVTEDVNGTPVEFAKMTVRQRFALLAEFKAAKRKIYGQDVLAAGATQLQYVAEMKAFDLRWNEAKEWIDYVNSTDGRFKIVEWAANQRKPNTGAAVADELAESGRLAEVMAKICGLTLTALAEDADGGEPDPTGGLADTKCPTPGT